MRAPAAAGLAAGLALTLVLAGTAVADEDGPTPSRGDVREAREAAADAERDVATVQADLVLANQRLQASAVEAAQAAEAWNGARFRLEQARRQVREAERRAGVANADVDRQQQAYADALATSYQMAPELSALSAIVDADGISGVMDKTVTVQSANDALDSRYDAFRASATLAEVATQQAEDAQAEAASAEEDARAARDQARAAADAANAEAQAVAEEKDRLIGELARLQQVSKEIAERRQSALEQAAAEAAAEAAAAAAQAEQEAQEAAEEQEAQEAAEAAAAQAEQEQEEAEDEEQTPAPTPAPHPAPQPAPTAPPAPSGGASAAVAFARAQIGEPYRWGAAGPDAWDCSGLTAGAWNAGGQYLPHYSVAQYEQSTPISAGELRAGDLVFWGSSSSPSSIYHVALYAGGGTIIHAPRTGRPVTEESMYYWTAPNFYARP